MALLLGKYETMILQLGRCNTVTSGTQLLRFLQIYTITMTSALTRSPHPLNANIV